jgi:hypothetical protein
VTLERHSVGDDSVVRGGLLRALLRGCGGVLFCCVCCCVVVVLASARDVNLLLK